MNIIEAIKSDLPFKRKNGTYWYIDAKDHSFVKAEILATDWEVEERKIEITESELNQILNEVIGTHHAGSSICTELKRRIFYK